jgi:hypothetical protein
MINLKKFFKTNPYLLTVSRAEKEVLECFLDNKAEFEHWISFQQNRRTRFQFYYPTAVDFYFDDFKLFTAYFKRGAFHTLELQELKMTEANYSSIRSANWQPFAEVIVNFLNTLEENNKLVLFRQRKSLHEYVELCKDVPAEKGRQKELGILHANG